ncbi:MAG: DUF5615 family PIN-like protein [Phycisphaerales bacterium]|nr:DUF5615 family PIN-like protein [Phycisphaerales bacterium]
MKIKVDENLPDSLAKSLRKLGHDVRTVYDQDMVGVDDADLWPAVVAEGRFLITQDKRFMDARRLIAPGSPGAMLVRMMDDDAERVFARVLEVFRSESVETWAGCSVTLSMAKLRVTRELPPAKPGRRKDKG